MAVPAGSSSGNLSMVKTSDIEQVTYELEGNAKICCKARMHEEHLHIFSLRFCTTLGQNDSEPAYIRLHWRRGTVKQHQACPLWPYRLCAL